MKTLPAINVASPFASMKGSDVALRVPDFEASKRWFVEKLDFRVIHEWPFGDPKLADMAGATDDTFWVEILGGGAPGPQPDYSNLNGSLHQAGYHHFCINVESVDATLSESRRRDVAIVGEPFDLASIERRLAFVSDPWGNSIELAQILP
jgi:catechol 2,3-dioxygenase-like lactoylglutathione lyase family enzyme